MTYSEFTGRYKVLLPYRVRKTIPAIATSSAQSQSVSKLQSSTTLQNISPNRCQCRRLSSKRCSTKKHQSRVDANIRKAAKLIICRALGVTSTSSPLPALDKENNLRELNSLDVLWTGNGCHLGQQRVLLQENQVTVNF